MGESRGIELAETMQGEAPPGPLRPGDRAGDYEITGVLGSGAMGEVYAGTHPVIGKRVAIKVIKQVLAKNEESAQRFIREAKAVNQIDHPNVIDVFAFGRLADGRLYLVMDLLEGASLDQHLKTHGALSVDEFLTIMEPLCAAVDSAHQAGIVHRDLKPANVFLANSKSEDQHLYVLDFGVAKLMSSAQETLGQTLTGQGAWIGTPVYMAPEQWTSEGANPRSDIYALGAMGYELLSGQSPFQADSIPGVMEKHFHAEIPRIRDTGRALPRHIDDALRQAMAKDPDDRFADAGQFFEALKGERKARSSSRKNQSSGLGVLPMAMGAALVVAAGAALYIVKVRKDEPMGERAAAASAESEPDPSGRLRVASVPAAARVFSRGQLVGETPTDIPGDPGESLTLLLRKPGYLDRSIDCKIGDDPMQVELAPVTGFAGRWKVPSGELREFKREGESIHAYKPSGGTWAYYRKFRLINSDSGVVFEAHAEHVDEATPNAPSCRINLAAQYRYDPATKTMSTRNEKVDYSKQAGTCVDVKRSWTDYQPVIRVAMAPTSDRTTVTSRAGGGGRLGNANGNTAPKDTTKGPANINGAQFQGKDPAFNPSPPQKKTANIPRSGNADADTDRRKKLKALKAKEIDRQRNTKQKAKRPPATKPNPKQAKTRAKAPQKSAPKKNPGAVQQQAADPPRKK